MADVYRIEIPIEAINATDASAVRALETALQRITNTANKGKHAVQEEMNSINAGASGAASALNSMDASFGRAAQSTEQLGDSAEDASDSLEDMGSAGQEAGEEAGGAFGGAKEEVDGFTKRIEKSQQSLRKMFGEKFQLTLAAIDKVSPILKSVGSSIKNITAKAWHVALKMKDMITAPFRKLKQMIMSPLVVTLSMAGIGLGASSFLSTFTDFSTGMSNVKALSGATQEEFADLTKTAEELGATTKFTAAEASQGMQYLAMAGWKTSEIIEAMPGLLDLAAAGATDLGTAADIVSDVMTAMGMSASEASKAADIFARTATSSNTTISTIGESLKYAAPIAHSFGLSLSEVSTMVGMMGNAGIKASQAGTAIRSSLLGMASPSKEASDLMKQLGLSFSKADGSMKNMGTIIGELQEAFAGLTAEQRLNYAETLFGTMASSAWLGMIDQGADEYNKLYNAIDNSTGAAREMSEIQLDNLQGDMTKLQSAVDGMKITLMKQLDPYLRQGVQWLTGKIPAITDMVSNFVTKGIEKAKELKNFLQGVFTSADFQNADGFIDKFFVAWDKIIAEPFQKWWDGGGQDTILGAVGKIGKNLGDLWHGIISGIFAALKGEDIDFEGLNLTGLAKAGAQAAKAFIESFKDAFDLGGLWADMPGLLKTGLLGFGALKLGGGALGIVKTINQIKTAFVGVKVAAGAATTATTGVGAATVTAAAGAGKAATLFGMVGKALSAIPVWGWVAAAALTAVTVGVIAYSNAQKQHEKDLLNTGKAAEYWANQYVASVNKISEATDTMETIKEIKLKVAEDKGGNAQVIKEFNDELNKIEYNAIVLYAKMADKAISDEDKAKLQSELDQLEAEKQALIHTKLAGISRIERALLNLQIATLGLNDAQIYSSLNEPTEDDVTAMNGKIQEIALQKAQVYAQLSDAVDPVEVAALNATITALTLAELTIKAKLGTLTDEDIKTANTYIGTLGTTLDTIKLKAAMGELTTEDIAAANEMIAGLELQKATIQTILDAGDGTLTEEEETSLKTLIDAIETHKAEIEAKLKNDGSLTDTEKAALQGEIDNLNTKKVLIESLLSNGGNLDATTKAALEAELAELNKEQISISAAVGGEVDDSVLKSWLKQNDNKEVNLKAKLDASGYSFLQMALITSQVNSIDEAQKEFTLILTDKSTLKPEEIAAYEAKLKELATKQYTYELMIQGAGLADDKQKITDLKTELDKIKSKTAKLTLSLNDSNLTAEQRQGIVKEITDLQSAAADIQLVLKGAESAGNTEEINKMKEELATIRGEEAAIYLNLAYAPGSEIKQGDLDNMVSLMNKVGTMNAQLNISLADGSMGEKELKALNEELQTAYGNLIEMSGGRFTQRDVDRGLITQERFDSWVADMEIEAATQRNQQFTEVKAGRNNVEELVQKRDQARAESERYEAQYAQAFADYDFMQSIETRRKNLASQYEAGQIGANELAGEGRALLTEMAQHIWQPGNKPDTTYWSNNPLLLFGNTAGGFSVDDTLDPFMGIMALLGGSKLNSDSTSSEAAAKAAEYNQALQQQYGQEVRHVELESFSGFGVADTNSTATIQQIADSYTKLDAAGQQMFASAIAGLAQLNESVGYLADTEKVDIGEVLGGALKSVTDSANTQVLGDINKELTELSTAYQKLENDTAKAEYNAQNIEKVNAALEALGLGKIDSLADLSGKLQEIAAIDPSGLDFTAAAASLEALGGDATSAKEKVEAAKKQLDALAGTYNVTIKYNVIGNVPDAPKTNAQGGIYDGAFLSWVAEDGPEAIIPLGGDKRGRGLDLWLQAGRMLGVSEFADGGIMAPYSGLIDIPDDWDDNQVPGPGGGHGGNTIQVYVTAEPTFQVEGGESGSVMDQIKAHQHELAEILGADLAEELEDIFSNIV